MNNYFKRVVLVALSSLVLLGSYAAPALAQTSIGLQLKPAVIEDKVNPGELHNYTLTATNITTTKGTFYIIAQDIKGVDEQSRPVFSTSNEVTGYELSSWMTLPVGAVTLEPGESKTISFSVRIPTGASPGSHFAGVFFSDKPVAPSSNGTGVGFNVGSIVSLRISGDIHEGAQLKEFSTGKFIYGTGDVDFIAKVQNLGNVLVQPTGVIEISNMFGKEVANVSVNQSLASVFPGLDRAYTAQWKSDSFAFGRYQAIVSLVYGDTERKTIYSTTSFWVLPLVPIATVLGSILIVVLAIFWSMRMYVQKKLRQMGVTSTSRADTDFYRNKYKKSSSRLMIVTMSVVLLCIALLVVLFLLFA